MRDQRDRVSCAVATANGLAMRIWNSSASQRKLAANTTSFRLERDLTNLGESTGALAIYEENLNFRRRLAKIDPRNSQWQRDGAYFLDRIGDEYREVGMNQRAIAAYEESLAIWRQLAKIDWRNPQRQLNISVSLNKLGDVKLDAGDDMGALAAYEESLTIRRHLSKGDPNNAGRQLNVAESLEKTGDLKLVSGDIDGALVAYREMLSIDRALVAIDGSNSEWQRNLLLSLERFGDVTLIVGDTIAAVAAYEESVALRRRLAASGKTDTQWQKEVSASLERISRLKRWAIYEGMLADDSQLAEAVKTNANQRGITAKVAATELAAQEESLAISRQLAESDPSNTNYQFDVSTKLEGVADMKLRCGDAAGALTIYEESLGLCRSLADANRASKKLRQNICNTLEKIGDLKLAKKDNAGALVLYEESLGLRRRFVEVNGQYRREVPVTIKSLSDTRNFHKTEKDNIECQREVFETYDRLENTTLGIGAILRELSKSEEIDAQGQRDVSVSLEKVGDAKLNLGDNVGAITAFQDSLAIRRTLADRDKDNAQGQWDVLFSLEKVANARLSIGDTHGALAAFAEILALTRPLLQTDKDNIEWQRGVSVPWDRLRSATLGIGAALRKFSALSLPKLLVATIRQSRRCLRTGSVIVGRSSAQVRAWVRDLQRSAVLKGLTPKWLLLAPSSFHNAFSRYGGTGRIPKRNEPIGSESHSAPFQHERSTRGQIAIWVPIRKENTANNLLTATASSTGVEVTGKTDIQTSGDQSSVNTRSGKRRRRKRKRRNVSHCLPASQKSDVDRARMN